LNVPLMRKLWQGALAGVAGAAVMQIFRIGWEKATKNAYRSAIFGFDHEADVKSAHLLLNCFSRERITETEAARLGLTLHYMFGALLGTLYRATRSRFASPSPARALALGALLWLCADEIPISIAGISDPAERSIASHTSAFTAHLLFVITLEETFSLMDR
jgi:hypothetical protein